MTKAAAKKGVKNPWKCYHKAQQYWIDWWEGKAQAKGQTPSAMFLWYLVFSYRTELDNLISTQDTMKHLTMTFNGSTEQALDTYCAQLQFTDKKNGEPIFSTYEKDLRRISKILFSG